MIINWANNNQGFLDACFSFFALLLSGISIIIAIRALRVPYRKRLQLKVITGIQFHTENPSLEYPYICISVVNTGNRTVKLTELCLFCNGKRIINPDTPALLDEPIPPAFTKDVKHVDYHKEFMTIAYSNKDYLKNQKWYGYAKDTEGREYKRRSKDIEQLFSTYYSILDKESNPSL